MLQRQKIWVPILQHNPHYAEGVQRFLHNNPMSTRIATTLGLRVDNMYVALEADGRHKDKKVARFLAVPFTVTSSACGAIAAGSRRPLSGGFATNTSDSLNSLHVMERLLPGMPIHVSVCLQVQQQRTVYEGDQLVIVSCIDKIGKRMAYCKTDFFLDEEKAPSSIAKAEQQIQTVDDLEKVLNGYSRVISGSHVKSILEKSKKESISIEAKA